LRIRCCHADNGPDLFQPGTRQLDSGPAEQHEQHGAPVLCQHTWRDRAPVKRLSANQDTASRVRCVPQFGRRLAGADAHGQQLTAAVGAGNKTWRAYLSTNAAGSSVNGRDRIGRGPWACGKRIVPSRSDAVKWPAFFK